MFIDQKKPKDFDCGYNLDLMIAALPRIEDTGERVKYAKRVVGLIKQSHPTWVGDNGKSEAAWEHFFKLAEYNPDEYGIHNPYSNGEDDDAE
ncbi:DUF4290 domain-containing protein [Gracilimonas mengyeensis]|uniref:DUF4290 domain-containing protein n=1 Tax=Gracilimonas mengyeensis TaxID=1302730 RepID=A0A521AMT7_9BACT|nr:DUF4290 domain-containing protein [Gracilimonas mengyeensis]SMO36117.1 protein of unknown function [Gracilimonas mengyeensis]